MRQAEIQELHLTSVTALDEINTRLKKTLNLSRSQQRMIKLLKQYYQLHLLLTRLTLDVDVLVLFELPLSRSGFGLVGLLTLDLKHYNFFSYHNCVLVMAMGC